MLRRIVVSAAVAAASLGGFLLAAPAHADGGPGACVSLNVSVNGTGQAQNVCTPALPAAPAVP